VESISLNKAQQQASQLIDTNRENRNRALGLKIKAEISSAEKTEEAFSFLNSRAQQVRRLLGASDPNRLSEAADALSFSMGKLTQDLMEASDRVSRIAQGASENPELLWASGELASSGRSLLRLSQDMADQICLVIVQPLRQRRLKQPAQQLSTLAPALLGAGERFSAETDRLLDLVAGDRNQPRTHPRRRNFCDPTDIWPRR
jgi:hypothetical protein